VGARARAQAAAREKQRANSGARSRVRRKAQERGDNAPLLALNASLNCTNDIFGRGLQRARAGRRAGRRWERRERTSADGEDAFPAHASCVCANERAPPLARANKKQSYTRVHETHARGRLAAACAEGGTHAQTAAKQQVARARRAAENRAKNARYLYMIVENDVQVLISCMRQPRLPNAVHISLGQFHLRCCSLYYFFSLTAVLALAFSGERKQRRSLDSQRQWTRSRRRRLPRPTSPA
jgi:hypothetical protein